MKTIAPLAVPLFAMIGAAHAHVAELPPAQHAAEHGWLALALIPLLVLLPMLWRRN